MDRMKSLWTLAGAAALVVIIAVSGIVVASSDRQAPKITIENTNVTYVEGQDYSSLLVGVSAYDKRDGDVTASLIVESVTPLKSGEQAKVWYVAKDKSNNITKLDRLVHYVASGNHIVQNPENKDPSDRPDETGSAGENPDDSTKDNSSSNPSTGQEETLPTQPPGAIPVLTLKSSEGTIHVGERFNVVSYVDNIVDDVDERDVLFRRIIADGNYDVNTVGDYTLTIYCSDTDRNLSESRSFVLHVIE